MADPRPSSFADLAAILRRLPQLLADARRARGLSMREAGGQLDMSFATVARIEQGEDCALSNAVKVLAWLDQREANRG